MPLVRLQQLHLCDSRHLKALLDTHFGTECQYWFPQFDLFAHHVKCAGIQLKLVARKHVIPLLHLILMHTLIHTLHGHHLFHIARWCWNQEQDSVPDGTGL